jgi:protein-tyrosine-phosphatase
MLNKQLALKCNELLAKVEVNISDQRKSILNEMALYMHTEIKKNNGEKELKVVYLCTHNSRRSHFAQVWGHIAALHFGIEDIKVFSGGTVATACHPNTVSALEHIGFKVTCSDLNIENPMYHVFCNSNEYIECYSKANTAISVPQTDFMAVMTCSDADENCPLVPGAQKRFSTTYDDPKEFDGTSNPIPHYVERSLQIASEILYTFQQLASMA